MKLLSRSLDTNPVRSLHSYETIGGGAGLRAASHLSASEIIATIGEAGLRGRGGAGFPTAVKFATVADSRSDAVGTTVVVNAAEGEPGTFKDRALLRTNPYRLLEGAIIAALAVGATDIKIGIKVTFEREIFRLQQAIAELKDAGWFGDLGISIVCGPSSYLFGEETGMLEVIQGRQPFPRVTPPFRRGIEEHDTRSAGGVHLAAIGGSDEPPALVDNVETLCNVALILAHGADWFREVGTERSPGTIVCTVSGATRRQGVGEVAMGTTLREVIELVGWGVQRDSEIGIVVSGTANALIPPSLLDTPLTYEAMRDAGTGLGSAGFIVFDETTDPVAIAQGISRFLAIESCGQCEPCKRDGAVLAASLSSLARSDIAERSMADLRSRVQTVNVGARCNLAYQQSEVVGSLLNLFGDTVANHVSGRCASEAPVVIVPIANMQAGRAVADLDQLKKQPDWSTNRIDSGAAPAAYLGNTPVHLELPSPNGRAAPWTPGPSDDHPLAMLDEAHELLDRVLGEAFHAESEGRGEALDKLSHLVRVHVDVTRRVLYPMARRYGGETGESIADDAERQESSLLSALRNVERDDHGDWPTSMGDLAVELQRHADCEDALIDILRESMDLDERSVLADGLAEARSTFVLASERKINR